MNWNEEEQKAIDEAREMRAYIAAHMTERMLNILERQFETDLPCFQGSRGSYDPFDAMKRDAQREVVLWLRLQIKQHKQDIKT